MNDRDAGILDRILAAPVRPGELIAGRALAVAALGTSGLVTVWAVTTVAFGAHWGPTAGVLPVLVATVLAIAGVTLVVASLGRTEQQVGALTGIVQDTAATFTATAVSARLTGAPVAEIARDLARTAPPVAVASRDVGAGAGVEPNRFSEVAPRNLILFVFINSLASAAFIVSVRRCGVLHRAASTRSGVPALLAGLALGWLVLALAQSALIVAVGALAFGVDWGDPLAGGLLLLAFAGVGCGGGLVVGAIGRDPERTSSITPFVGIVLGAIGGCMVPLEFFPPAIDAVAHVTPHYWAVTGWEDLIIDGGGLADVGVNLAVLAVMAVALSAAAILRHQLARG